MKLSSAPPILKHGGGGACCQKSDGANFHAISDHFWKKIFFDNILKSTFKFKAGDIDLRRRTDVYDWIIIGTTSQDAGVQGWDNHSNKTGCQSFFLSNHAIIQLLSFWLLRIL